MANQQVVDYIQQASKAGMDRNTIKQNLIQNGFTESDVEEAFVLQEALPQTPLPTPTPIQTTFTNSQITKPSSKNKLIFFSAIIISILLLGGGAYAYVMKIGPFARPPYTEKNLLTGLLGSVAKINTSSYTGSASLTVSPREPGAVPFIASTANQAEHRKEYQYDYKRVSDISNIIQSLQFTNFDGDTYPRTLDELETKNKKGYSSFYGHLNVKDPQTAKAYSYATTENGKNYTLSFTLNTSEAVSQIRNSYGNKGKIKIAGNTVTLSKDTSYIYISSELPKPFLLQLSEAMAQLPSDIKGSLSVSAQTDWQKENADWKFNLNATGDFGDLAYKIDTDAIKKDDTYYFRINNMPSLFLMFIGNIKGSWYKIDTKAATSSEDTYDENILSSIAQEIPKTEKSYKESRKDLTNFLRSAAELADQEQLFVFKKPPTSETVDGRVLYRYELGIKKEAIIPFYEKLLKKVNSMKQIDKSLELADPAFLEYLKSDDFKSIFDYYDKNTSLTISVDPEGFPAIISYKMRIVPQDSVEQFKDKQLNLTWKLVLANINKNVDIKAPENAKDVNDITDQGALGSARIKGRDARRIADTRQIQLALELYADANGQQYPTSLASLAPKYISTVPVDPLNKTAYKYFSSLVKGKRTFYHLGASLESIDNNGLNGDEDSTSGFDGGDEKGCSGEVSRFCYDVTP